MKTAPASVLLCLALAPAITFQQPAYAQESAVRQLLLREVYWTFVPMNSRTGEGVAVWFENSGNKLMMRTNDTDTAPCAVQVHSDGFTLAGCMPARWHRNPGDPVWQFRGRQGQTEFGLRRTAAVPTGRAPGGP